MAAVLAIKEPPSSTTGGAVDLNRRTAPEGPRLLCASPTSVGRKAMRSSSGPSQRWLGKSRAPGWSLWAGGRSEAATRALVNEHDLGSAVEFCGTVQDVWPVLAGSHVFVLASWYEPLGIAVLEAMAAGLPVVATGVGGLRELVQPGTTGWLVTPGDHFELALRITQLLTNADLRRQFGRAAAVAAAPMTEDRMVGKYYDMYKTLAVR